MRFKVFDSLLRDYNHSKFDQTIFDMIEELQKEVKTLQEQYSGALLDIKRLEEENVELTNELYRLENSLDARIDILAEHCRIVEDV
jgi:regulator of replication initiation timing